MSYFPLFNIGESSGFVSIPNFAPTDWKPFPNQTRYLHAFRLGLDKWECRFVEELKKGDFGTYKTSDFEVVNTKTKDGVEVAEYTLFVLNDKIIKDHTFNELPQSTLPKTTPEWRATIGFRNKDSQVSYQGEINPFPSKASLLTFHPFIQYQDIRNYFVFLNLESNPKHRWVDLRIYSNKSKSFIANYQVRNNAANIIYLDNLGIQPDDLPIFTTDSMAGIPFGFGVSQSTSMLSLEHTHPPASLTLHGDRWLAQKTIKKNWSLYINK